MKKLVIFDLDYTLINVNSHYEVFEYAIKNKNILKFIFKLFTSKYIRHFIEKLFNQKDFKRCFSIYLTKYLKEEEIEDAVVKRFSDIKSLLNIEIYNILLSKINNSDFEIKIISGTFNHIAKYLSTQLNLEIYSSVIKNGKYLYDMQGKKLEYIKENFKNHIFYLFISDNFEDINYEFQEYILVYDGIPYKRIKGIEINE